jgi:site-specific DNA-cytosine methylase
MRKKSYVTVTDQFCGAGGSSLGAVAAGSEVKLALNHWDLAIKTHNTNFPDTDHDCTDISAVDPRRYRRTDVLITSPECFPAETLILTTQGLVPIENIKVGDLVLTHSNKWMPVMSIMQRTGDTVVISGQGHRALETTMRHPYFVRMQSQVWNNAKRDYDRRILGEPEWIAACDLANQRYRWASPACMPSLPIPPVIGANGRSVEFSTKFWWMIGRWLGDGSVRLRGDEGHNEITICCGKHEIMSLEAYLNFAPRTSAHASGVEMHWRKREIRTAYLFECGHDSLATWIVKHFGKGAHAKTLPAWALSMRQDWREALLDGYVSADGYRTDRYTSVGSVSKALALSIRLLLVTLGYHPTFGCYNHKGGAIEGRPFDAYDLWIVRWENNRSQRTGIVDGEHAWTLVKSIKPGRKAVALYNLSVAEDESYVADGIVVHNCTNHSLAKGKRRRRPDLFGNGRPDPSEERSRATMWDVPRFAEFHDYEIIVVENVVDARVWRLWDAWLHAMRSLNYEYEIVYYNSMFAHPTPQSRDRMYVVFWKKGNRVPNLKFTPLAYCIRCEQNVGAVQSWKRPDKQRWGRYGQNRQYVYRCPTCAEEVMPYYYCAFNAIDWSVPSQRIGDRKRPLKPKTMERIRIGLERYGKQPLMVQLSHSHAKGNRSSPVTDPFPTQTGRQTLAFVVNMRGEPEYNLRPIIDPLPVQTTIGAPYLVELHNTSTAHPITDPLGCVLAGGGHHGLVQPFLVSVNYFDDIVRSLVGPMPTQTTASKVGVAIPQPFLISYYSGSDQVKPMTDSLGTVSTHDRHALVMPHEEPKVEDCYFRMLKSHEIGRAMAFPETYVVLGNERERVKQYGNAVTPPVMEMILERCIETLR